MRLRKINIHAEVLILLGIALFFFFRFSYRHLLNPSSIYLMDFRVMHHMAQAFLHGNLDLYHVMYQPNFEFKYAPIWGLFFIPFGFFSLQTSSILWEFFTLLLMIANLHMIGLILKRYKISYHPLVYVAGVIVLSKVIVSEIMQGQTNFLISYLILLSIYLSLTRRWERVSSLVLSLAISLKLPALLFLFFFLKKKNFKVLMWAFIFFIGTNTIAAILLNPMHPLKLFSDWLNLLLNSGSFLLFNDASRSIFTLFGRYLSDHTRFHIHFLSFSIETIKGLVMTLGFVMTLISLFPFFKSKRRDLEKEEVLTLSTLMILIVIFNPSSWAINYVGLLLPVIMAVIVAGHILFQSRISLTLLSLLMICNILLHKKAWVLMGFDRAYDADTLFLPLPIFGILLYIFLIKAGRDSLLVKT